MTAETAEIILQGMVGKSYSIDENTTVERILKYDIAAGRGRAGKVVIVTDYDVHSYELSKLQPALAKYRLVLMYVEPEIVVESLSRQFEDYKNNKYGYRKILSRLEIIEQVVFSESPAFIQTPIKNANEVSEFVNHGQRPAAMPSQPQEERIPEIPAAVLQMPVEDLDLTVMEINALKKIRVSTVEDLVTCDASKLLDGLSKKSVVKINTTLETKGLKIGMKYKKVN